MSCQDPSAPRASLQKSLPPTEPAVGSVTAKTKRSASASEPAQVRSATGLGVETCKFFFFFERDEKEVERREVTLSERGRSNEVDGAKKREGEMRHCRSPQTCTSSAWKKWRLSLSRRVL
jgi:hypothetical protein